MFDLKLGFKCNNNCVHCVVANKREAGELKIGEICGIINRIPQGETVQITGGEPSIFKDLPSVLQKCKEKGLRTVIQSNGTGFSNQDFLNACKDNIDQVHLAIHSCYPEIHDKIVGSKGMWEKTIQGLDNLLKTDIYLTTQTVLSKLNIKSLYDTFCFIQDKKSGIKMSMTYPHVAGNAYKNREEIIFRYSDYKEEIQKTLSRFKDLIYTEAIPPCYLYPNFPSCSDISSRMDPNNIRMGIDFSMSKEINDYNISDLENKRKAPKCKECDFNKKCIGVWKEYIEQFRKCLDLYPVKIDTTE